MDEEILSAKMTALTHAMALCCILREHLEHPLIDAPKEILTAMVRIGDWVMDTNTPIMEHFGGSD